MTQLFRYGMRLRGFSIGCQPMKGIIDAKDDPTGFYHSILRYSRELTDQEMSDYELDRLEPEKII